jgi:hypothetical protein
MYIEKTFSDDVVDLVKTRMISGDRENSWKYAFTLFNSGIRTGVCGD